MYQKLGMAACVWVYFVYISYASVAVAEASLLGLFCAVLVAIHRNLSSSLSLLRIVVLKTGLWKNPLTAISSIFYSMCNHRGSQYNLQFGYRTYILKPRKHRLTRAKGFFENLLQLASKKTETGKIKIQTKAGKN